MPWGLNACKSLFLLGQELLQSFYSVSYTSGPPVPSTVHGNNSHNTNNGQLNGIGQKPGTPGPRVGSLSDLMESPRLRAGEDWEQEKKLDLNN